MKLSLTVVDTPGFGDKVRRVMSMVAMMMMKMMTPRVSLLIMMVVMLMVMVSPMVVMNDTRLWR